MSRPASPALSARTWTALVVGLVGVLAGLALPFCPVRAQTTTLTWPVPGTPVVSSTAVLTPYRPAELRAVIPCSVLRAGASAAGVGVLATGTDAESLKVDATAPATATVTASGRTAVVAVPDGDPDCRLEVDAGPDGTRLTGPGAGQVTDWPGLPVPQVFGFRTGLPATDAAGMQVSALISSPFGTAPSPAKIAVIVVQLVAAAIALWLLPRGARRTRAGRRRWRWRPVWWIDAAVLGVLAGWAVIGPLAVDDGWATTIARTVAATGSPGNYYRWWNASEVPFALCQQVLAPLTAVSLAPLWLRLPSTVLALATWWVLSRLVLRSALPAMSATWRVRGLAAVCFLAAWLPFNLGARPESYVALGVTTVLALAMRVRSPAGVGGLLLVAAMTLPFSPNSVIAAAPIVVFAPRLVRILRVAAPTRAAAAAFVALLGCVAAVALTMVFADETWDALVVATDWHQFFGPSLAWYEEPVRYQHLFQDDQQGSFAKRLPVLLAMVAIAVAAALALRHRSARRAGRLAAVVALALALFALSPSKWSYHLGAAAGLFSAVLTVTIVVVCRRRAAPNRSEVLVGAVGTVLAIGAAALAFRGPNAWWLPALYDVPWATSGPRVFGVPLGSPVPWAVLVVVAVVVAGISRRRGMTARVVAAGSALVAVTAMVTALVVVIGSFLVAPIRQPAGSLAMSNVHRLTGSRVCGLADDVDVLPDGAVLARSGDPGGALDGFVAQGGFATSSPPPDPLGNGIATFVWGSLAAGVQTTGAMTSPWFVLPAFASDGGVALSVSGRTDDGNTLALDFGRSGPAEVSELGERVPTDQVAAAGDPLHPWWRTVGVDAADVPAGADRVRIRAVDGRTDPFGWLAFTGPRLRSVVPLNQFLAAHGPVLISWPMSFLFPCVRDIPIVDAGMAQTPNAIIESPRPWSAQDRETDVGGSFTALAIFGDLREIPTRLRGHPEVDWGSLRVPADGAARDAYQRSVTETTVPGIGGSPRPRPER